MTDEELLKAAEAVLRAAIEEAAFTQLPKDLDYARMVAGRVEWLRAKLAGRDPVVVRLSLVGGRMMYEYKDPPGGFLWPR